MLELRSILVFPCVDIMVKDIMASATDGYHPPVRNLRPHALEPCAVRVMRVVSGCVATHASKLLHPAGVCLTLHALDVPIGQSLLERKVGRDDFHVVVSKLLIFQDPC